MGRLRSIHEWSSRCNLCRDDNQTLQSHGGTPRRWTDAAGTNSVALGQGSQALGAGSTAIGQGASTGLFNNAAAIGNGAVATRDNQVVIGTASNTYTAPGITSAASKAAQSGSVQVVTSDANGNLATDGGAISNNLNIINQQITAIAQSVEQLNRDVRRGLLWWGRLFRWCLPHRVRRALPGTGWRWANWHRQQARYARARRRGVN